MAEQVAGEDYFDLTGQLLEIGRQLRQPKGYPFDTKLLKAHLQAGIEGIFVRKYLAPSHVIYLKEAGYFSAYATFLQADLNFVPQQVCILGENFKQYFLGVIEESLPETHVSVRTLLSEVLDAPVVAELKEHYYTIKLGHFHAAWKNQATKSPQVPFSTRIVAFVEDCNQLPWRVVAQQDRLRGGWYIEAYRLQSIPGLLRDDHILSTLPR